MQSKLVISGNLVEYVKYERDTSISATGKVSGRNGVVRHKIFGVKRIDNLARARRTVVRKLFTCASTATEATFVTFTFRENLSTRSTKVAGTFFSQFLKRLQRKFKGEYTVVGVPERHESARIHIHAMLFGRAFREERQNRILAGLWGLGNVDVRSHDMSPKMLYYVAKYVTKQEADFDFRSPSYWCTRNIDKSLEYVDDNAEFFQKKISGVTISESIKGSVYFGQIIRKTRLLK